MSAAARRHRRRCGLAAALAATGLAVAAAGVARAADTPSPTLPAAYRDRPPEDEVVYFVLPDRFANGDPTNDRGGLAGDRLVTGFDPTSEKFYNGGDLKGLMAHLDYIQGLGATTIWLGPVFKNRPVQGPPGGESAGYHGYWITDFTQVDPHFGTNDDFRALVNAVHARGMKLYMDIVANHTADVIRYRECPTGPCRYRSKGDFPYTRKGGVGGMRINDGFLGDDDAHQTTENFARLTRDDYAYTPFIPPGDEHAKAPDWLNDPHWYHNRGESTYTGESATYGDFAGLDDLFTEQPRVIAGFIDIYGRWIDDFGIDGYRIDTAKHVNTGFWRQFIPAMLSRARAKGIPNFHIFGEVYDPDTAFLASFTRTAGYPAVLDFGFQSTVAAVVAQGGPTERLAHLFASDADYAGGADEARRLPTFLGNHDMGRFAMMVRKANPAAPDSEVLARVRLAHAMMFFLRGQPVIYYGDEQGFAGVGGDNAARQSLFASRVSAYNATPLVGTASTTAADNYNPQHPLYRAFSEMARLRRDDPALRRGDQVVRISEDGPGLFAVSRHPPSQGARPAAETVVVFNTATTLRTARIEVDIPEAPWRSEHGTCAPAVAAPGSYSITVPPLDYIICTTAKPK